MNYSRQKTPFYQGIYDQKPHSAGYPIPLLKELYLNFIFSEIPFIFFRVFKGIEEVQKKCVTF